MTAFTLLPGAICIGGVYFAHFGLASAVALYNIGLAVSVSNALWPLIKHERAKAKTLVHDVAMPLQPKQQPLARPAGKETLADLMQLPALPDLTLATAEPA